MGNENDKWECEKVRNLKKNSEKVKVRAKVPCNINFQAERECGSIKFFLLKIVEAHTISEILLNHIFAKGNQKKSY